MLIFYAGMLVGALGLGFFLCLLKVGHGQKCPDCFYLQEFYKAPDCLKLQKLHKDREP